MSWTNEDLANLASAVAEARENVNAIVRSRRPRESRDVAIAALVRAVEILVDHVNVETPGERAARVVADAEARGVSPLQALEDAGFEVRKADAAHTAPERQEQSTTASNAAPAQHGFDEGLVDSFQAVYRKAYEHTFVTETSNEWQCEQDGIRAILTELARMPCELPTAGQIQTAHSIGSATNTSILGAEAVRRMLEARLGPVLAAKATCIDKLGRELVQAKARVAEVEKTTCELPTPEVIDFFLTGCTFPVPSEKAMTLLKMLRNYIDPIIAAKDEEIARQQQVIRLQNETNTQQSARITELEAQRSTPANECTNAERTQYELTIEQQKARLMELQTALDSAKDRLQRAEADLDGKASRIAGLEQRLAEATKVPTVDGKTLGQVNYEGWYLHRNPLMSPHWSSWVDQPGFEAGAQAVLRTFGGEVLRRVRERIDGLTVLGTVQRAMAAAIIDSELASLGVKAGEP